MPFRCLRPTNEYTIEVRICNVPPVGPRRRTTGIATKETFGNYCAEQIVKLTVYTEAKLLAVVSTQLQKQRAEDSPREPGTNNETQATTEGWDYLVTGEDGRSSELAALEGRGQRPGSH